MMNVLSFEPSVSGTSGAASGAVLAGVAVAGGDTDGVDDAMAGRCR